MELISNYKNGNYTVKLYSDGTKIKETEADSFIAEFPDSIDLKITNYCDLNCPMCHEKSNIDGKEGNLDSPFLESLPSGIELAIGGGNPLSHSALLPFLEKMKKREIICNLTVNEKHLIKNKEFVQKLIDEKLIYGLGISAFEVFDETVAFARKNENCVLHIVTGVFENFEKIIDKNLKVLFLGYKKFGKGKNYFSLDILRNIEKTKKLIPRLISRFSRISFDNLALSQLDIKRLLTDSEWDKMYMGDDGEGSMYIDLVEQKFAKSSISTKRFSLKDDIKEMFLILKMK
ncbi:MAG: radical SAM protein [Clostridia bacterium]|nr:radical SAM protein [Clostridia bacterium]